VRNWIFGQNRKSPEKTGEAKEKSVADNWFFRPNHEKPIINWWKIDAYFDSSIYNAWARFLDRWLAYSNFINQFRVTGFRRLVAELLSEAATLGAGGLVVLLAFAIPALELTKDPNWRQASEYSVTFLDINGNEIGKRGNLFSDAVPLEEIPDYMIKATLATEDRRFFDHFGIDIFGTIRALYANLQANSVVEGGSSITQQLAKNLFLSSEQSLTRKINEAFLALWLELHLSKKEILKMYLDRAPMGGKTYGVEAASQFFFGKSVRDVNLAEAALLAGLYKAPSNYSPYANPIGSRERTNEVLTNMVEAGYMTEGQVHSARLNPAKVIERSDFYVPNYYLDWAFTEVRRIMQGKNQYNLVARTTIDLSLQKAAEKAMADTLEANSTSYHVDAGALVSMETDGAVRAMVGGRDYNISKFNRATMAYRQPGSSFKTYVYLTALEGGATPNMMVSDSTQSCAGWVPKNYSGGYHGSMTLTMALAKSLNTVAVQLSLRDKYGGREKVLRNLAKLGFPVKYNGGETRETNISRIRHRISRSCSLALGDQGVTVLDHTSGYATFAHGGKRVKGYAITEIHNSQGNLVYSRKRDEKPDPQIFKRKVVETLNQMLSHVITEGTGRRAQLDFTTVVGKTGTSSGYKDAWFMGFTGKYVTGIWMGNDSFKPTNRVTGGSLPAQTWQAYNIEAHKNNYNIPAIPGLPLHPRQVEEQKRIAQLKKEDPTMGTVTERPSSGQYLPLKTQKVLQRLSKMFKEARPLENAALKGAGLDTTTGTQ
jgi:penicillin-binding protein 1A